MVEPWRQAKGKKEVSSKDHMLYASMNEMFRIHRDGKEVSGCQGPREGRKEYDCQWVWGVGVWRYVLKLNVITVAELIEYSNNRWIVYFK